MSKSQPSTKEGPELINYMGTYYRVAGFFRRKGEKFVTFCGESGIERSVPLAKVSVIA
ncbi:MAG: hypothetical protein AAB463_01320 [Patescibacteria group bacterium]